MGIGTNNQAEYKAILAAMETAALFQPQKITCHLDSELVVRQLRGEYRVKNSELRQLWEAVQGVKKKFSEVRFVSVHRTNDVIQQVDRLVNLTLDEEMG